MQKGPPLSGRASLFLGKAFPLCSGERLLLGTPNKKPGGFEFPPRRLPPNRLPLPSHWRHRGNDRELRRSGRRHAERHQRRGAEDGWGGPPEGGHPHEKESTAGGRET